MSRSLQSRTSCHRGAPLVNVDNDVPRDGSSYVRVRVPHLRSSSVKSKMFIFESFTADLECDQMSIDAYMETLTAGSNQMKTAARQAMKDHLQALCVLGLVRNPPFARHLHLRVANRGSVPRFIKSSCAMPFVVGRLASRRPDERHRAWVCLAFPFATPVTAFYATKYP